jgi:hypothetical protein
MTVMMSGSSSWPVAASSSRNLLHAVASEEVALRAMIGARPSDGPPTAMHRFQRVTHHGMDVEPSLRASHTVGAGGEDPASANLCDIGPHWLCLSAARRREHALAEVKKLRLA